MLVQTSKNKLSNNYNLIYGIYISALVEYIFIFIQKKEGFPMLKFCQLASIINVSYFYM